MPKKTHKKSYKLSAFSKLLLASILLLVVGYTYQLIANGTGPLSPFFTTTNTINLVNGLDPDEASYIQKAINSNSISANSATSKQISVIAKNPSSNKDEKAELRISNSTTPVAPNDGLEAEEAAFLQNSIIKDKAATGQTANPLTAPTVKVTVTSPTTGIEESALVKLNADHTLPLQAMQKEIAKKVVHVNSPNLSAKDLYCSHPSLTNVEVPEGGIVSNGNKTCSKCTFKNSTSVGTFVPTTCNTSFPASGDQTCKLYKAKMGTTRATDYTKSNIGFASERIGVYNQEVAIRVGESYIIKRYVYDNAKKNFTTLNQSVSCEMVGNNAKPIFENVSFRKSK